MALGEVGCLNTSSAVSVCVLDASCGDRQGSGLAGSLKVSRSRIISGAGGRSQSDGGVSREGESDLG